MARDLDTSGSVGEMPGWRTPVPSCNRFMRWEDLSPFTQGYVEAMLSTGRPLVPLRGDSQNPFRAPAFSDLAPETLARIIADCDGFLARHPGWDHPDGGRLFWGGRNGDEAKVDSLFGRTCRDHFPPVVVQLGDDGKVRFAEAR